MKPGLHDLSAHDYHADAISDRPTLSASIAHILCISSPAHAWAAHPKLNPDHVRVDEEKFDVGTASHALLLEGRDAVRVVEADDWRKKAAKQERDDARASGQIPLLAKDWQRVQAMCAATRTQLDRFDELPFFSDGQPEPTLVWDDEGVMCRARIDWLRDDRLAIDDFKSTKASANPEQWTRSTLFSIGADIQVAFYLRGMRALFGVEPDWRFVVQETYPPFALSVVSLGPDVIALAEKKVAYAIRLFGRCLLNDDWPAYPARVAWAELPPWEEARWLEKELREVPA